MVSSLLCVLFTDDLYNCQAKVSNLAVIRGKVVPMNLAFSKNLKFKIIQLDLAHKTGRWASLCEYLLRCYPSKQYQRFLLTSKNLSMRSVRIHWNLTDNVFQLVVLCVLINKGGKIQFSYDLTSG